MSACLSQDGIVIPMDKILATAKPPKESLAAINNLGIGEFHFLGEGYVNFIKKVKCVFPHGQDCGHSKTTERDTKCY